ncbi:FAD-dependent oxidoreductase [Aliiroseovarius subalbicans]|uniref:FAD-dependent oxidoreductase n=1 Tax=Aliiroseovarius subalbicans TaxID=2925840 RepID=UPI001F5851F9|nr:FAD-dependent oxidoreductase [Aliiroseovarius subalbicans]MCI2399637.1 FAD-dependent oxidoreductase [Aliiroseovarius subalbicans]
MSETRQYSVLFEPVRIGPVTARNRFFQVPHCNGMGHIRPQAEAAMRAVKAEGGWAVVSNQETEIHPTSDLSPFAENRLWDARDIPALRLMTDAVHDKGSLAAIELAHNGNHAQNLMTRAPVLAPSDMSLDYPYPKQARAMDKTDIRNFRRWHRDAAIRSRDAGFDIVYVYAGHNMTLPQHFLLPHMNDRTDEYGGSLENRLRLTRELLEETHDAVGATCAVAFRFAVDEMLGTDGMQAAEEGRAIVEMLAELPDLWDVNVCDWSNDSLTTRFQPQDGYQNDYISFVKSMTTKPVVAVGRLTSPDMMASMVKKGVVDFIGAARPSIADPFLPQKIEQDRIDEIRECIGCNICVMADSVGAPIRCTQNPTMGEEWRRGWHPEIIAPKEREEDALVIGAGPAGLECAMQLARRGYQVTLAEAGSEPGGRVLRESALPGLGAWARVKDHRLHDLRQRANVQIYTDSRLGAEDVLELGIPNVFIATGSHWRADGIGRNTLRNRPVMDAAATVLTPDDIMAGQMPPDGPVVVYDDDHAYIAGVIAEKLAAAGHPVIFVTPESLVSSFTALTLEQHRVQTRLLELGVDIRCNHSLAALDSARMQVACTFTGRTQDIACSSAVLVTERLRETALFDALQGRDLTTLELIGDAAGPALIADAVYAGHMAARNFERAADAVDRDWFRREIIDLTPEIPHA